MRELGRAFTLNFVSVLDSYVRHKPSILCNFHGQIQKIPLGCSDNVFFLFSHYIFLEGHMYLPPEAFDPWNLQWPLMIFQEGSSHPAPPMILVPI